MRSIIKSSSITFNKQAVELTNAIDILVVI